MSYDNVYPFFVNSKYRENPSDSDSNFTFTFNLPPEIREKVNACCVTKIVVPRSNYLIVSGYSDTLLINYNGTNLLATIPFGNYDVNSLNLALQNQLRAVTLNNSFVVSLNAITGKINITSNNASVVGYLSFKTVGLAAIPGNGFSYLGEILGFQTNSFSTSVGSWQYPFNVAGVNYVINGDSIENLSAPYDNLLLHASIIDNGYSDPYCSSDLACSIFMGGTQNFAYNEETYDIANQLNIRRIRKGQYKCRFTLTNELNTQIINLNGIDMSIEIKFFQFYPAPKKFDELLILSRQLLHGIDKLNNEHVNQPINVNSVSQNKLIENKK